MNGRLPGPSRRTRARPREEERSGAEGARNLMAQVGAEAHGYRVTLHPQSLGNEYYVKFSPLANLPRPSTVVPEPPQEALQIPTGSTVVRESEERYRVVSEPVGLSLLEVTTEPEGTSTLDISSSSLRNYVFEAILGMMEEKDPPRSRSRRRSQCRNRNRGNRRRRRRTVRRPQPSEPSMYEVVEVDYETISHLDAPVTLDWRMVPRYDLSSKEASRQEKELFFLLTSESNPEDSCAPNYGEPTCCVCHENAATRVVVPCGHHCLCRSCALHIATNRSVLGGVKLTKRCPMCQAAIGLMSRIRKMKGQQSFQHTTKKPPKPTKTPCRANAESLARNIIASAHEDPEHQYRNRSFSPEEQDPKSSELLARERLNAKRRRIREELLAARDEYPDADEYDIYNKLVERNAHPMTIAAQRVRIEKLQRGLPLPDLNRSRSPNVSPEQNIERESIEETPPELTYSRPFVRRRTPYPSSYFGEEAAGDRIKATRETVVREMREIREAYPEATEYEILKVLIDGGAHPQTIAIQQAKVKQQRELQQQFRDPPCTPKSPPRRELMQPRVLFTEDDSSKIEDSEEESTSQDLPERQLDKQPRRKPCAYRPTAELRQSNLLPCIPEEPEWLGDVKGRVEAVRARLRRRKQPRPCPYRSKTELRQKSDHLANVQEEPSWYGEIENRASAARAIMRQRMMEAESALNRQPFSECAETEAVPEVEPPCPVTRRLLEEYGQEVHPGLQPRPCPYRPTTELRQKSDHLAGIQEEPSWYGEIENRASAARATMRQRMMEAGSAVFQQPCPGSSTPSRQAPAAATFEDQHCPETRRSPGQPGTSTQLPGSPCKPCIQPAKKSSWWSTMRKKVKEVDIAAQQPSPCPRSEAARLCPFVDETIPSTLEDPMAESTRIRPLRTIRSPEISYVNVNGEPSGNTIYYSLDRQPSRNSPYVTVRELQDQVNSTCPFEDAAESIMETAFTSFPSAQSTPCNLRVNESSMERAFAGQPVAQSTPCDLRVNESSMERAFAGQPVAQSTPCDLRNSQNGQELSDLLRNNSKINQCGELFWDNQEFGGSFARENARVPQGGQQLFDSPEYGAPWVDASSHRGQQCIGILENLSHQVTDSQEHSRHQFTDSLENSRQQFQDSLECGGPFTAEKSQSEQQFTDSLENFRPQFTDSLENSRQQFTDSLENTRHQFMDSLENSRQQFTDSLESTRHQFMDSLENSRQQFTDNQERSQCGQQFTDSLEISRHQYQFYDSLEAGGPIIAQTSQSGQQYQDSLEKSQSGQQYQDSLEKSQSGQQYQDSLEKSQSGQQYQDSLEKSQSGQQYQDSLEKSQNGQLLWDNQEFGGSFKAEKSPCAVKNMIEEEKRELRAMHEVMSQLREIANKMQFKDMGTLVPHIFRDETETAPEVAAAMLYSDEKGLSLKATPAKVYNKLFHGQGSDKTVIRVNVPSPHTKAAFLVPTSSEGVEAALVAYQGEGYGPLPFQADSDMPPLSRVAQDVGSEKDNLGYSVSSIGKEIQASEDGRFKIMLEPDTPKVNDLIQTRGSQPPPWFPGYYVMLGNDKSINVIGKPWDVLEKAWRQFVPQKIRSFQGKVIVGS